MNSVNSFTSKAPLPIWFQGMHWTYYYEIFELLWILSLFLYIYVAFLLLRQILIWFDCTQFTECMAFSINQYRGPNFLSCSWCILRLGFSESQNNFYKKIKWFCKSDVLIFLTNTISCFCVSLTLFISLSVSLSLPCLCCYLCVCMCMWICTHTQTSVYVINISLKLFITVSLGFILTPKMYNWLHNYFNTLCG